MDTAPIDRGQISWRWKVQASLRGISDERSKGGDDYAARVFVVFGTGEANFTDNKALCYVWAGNEPVGSNFPSPYTENVATVVLRRGDAGAGDWVAERRNIVADYRTAFGESPLNPLVAVVLMVDTDEQVPGPLPTLPVSNSRLHNDLVRIRIDP